VDAKTPPDDTNKTAGAAFAPDFEPAGPLGLAWLPRFELSPLNTRRWGNFKANKRGYWALWIFLVLFFVTLFAEFIANDKPIFIHYDGKSYFPIIYTYPDTEFGDDLGTAADYRDPYTQKFLAAHNAIEIWPPIHFSYKTINDRPPSAFPSKPTWMLNNTDCDFAAKNGYAQCGALEMNWLGTDDQGRDVLARLIYGFRISVLFGLVLTIVSSVIGIAAGAVQGYFGGWTDLLFQRFIEIWTSVPELYLLLIISSVLVPGFFVLLGILLLFSWVRLVSLVRAEFLRGRNFEYIQAARALGVSNKVIMFRHLLPNAMVATMTFLPFIMSSSVMTLTALDFLGFGLPPGSPSLGELLSQAKSNVQAPWLGLTGFFTLALMLSLLIFIGEAVRDAFDPRKTYT
jgi:microcin C transport system permease protein